MCILNSHLDSVAFAIGIHFCFLIRTCATTKAKGKKKKRKEDAEYSIFMRLISRTKFYDSRAALFELSAHSPQADEQAQK